VEEFNIPQGLRNLYTSRNYGRWAVNGTVPVNFIASNHTSGGNSGSPVLNAKGELIGINFDRIWQGTMSDLYYEPSVNRNVVADIRYVLFIIEKYGNAGWLLNEMKLVK
jgi:S1-C subfamily serine protease